MCVCVCVCVCDLYKCILVAIYELSKALRDPKRRGAVQILIIIYHLIRWTGHSVHIYDAVKRDEKRALPETKFEPATCRSRDQRSGRSATPPIPRNVTPSLTPTPAILKRGETKRRKEKKTNKQTVFVSDPIRLRGLLARFLFAIQTKRLQRSLGKLIPSPQQMRLSVDGITWQEK